MKYTASEPTRSTWLPYGKQFLDEDDVNCVVQVLKGDFLTTGPAIAEFENKVKTYVGAKYAVAFSNGTAALHGACFAAGISSGDEVITTPLTFAASANCVLYQGGTPVFVDVDDHLLLDYEKIEEAITPRTKAIIPVDLTGQPVNLDEIMNLAREHNLIVIQDAAHSLGATYKGQFVGSIADMTMFSFHPVKHVTSGEGGIITTNNPEYYEKLLLFRSHGITRNQTKLLKNEGPWYYEMQELGYNYRMTDIQAALGASQMGKLSVFVERRREVAALYNKLLADNVFVDLPKQHADAVSSWHLYVVQLRFEQLNATRREIFEGLWAENIGVNVHYIPVYKLPYYQQIGYKDVICAKSEYAYERMISLPIFPAMTNQDVHDVVNAIEKVCSFYAK